MLLERRTNKRQVDGSNSVTIQFNRNFHVFFFLFDLLLVSSSIN